MTKSLNLKSLESINENINFPDDLLYSIQFFQIQNMKM